jgi:hypothetical protein
MISFCLLLFAKGTLLLLLNRDCSVLLSYDLGGPDVAVFRNRASLRQNYL